MNIIDKRTDIRWEILHHAFNEGYHELLAQRERRAIDVLYKEYDDLSLLYFCLTGGFPDG